MIRLNLTGYNTEIHLALFGGLFIKYQQATAFLTLKHDVSAEERKKIVASKYFTVSAAGGGMILAFNRAPSFPTD